MKSRYLFNLFIIIISVLVLCNNIFYMKVFAEKNYSEIKSSESIITLTPEERKEVQIKYDEIIKRINEENDIEELIKQLDELKKLSFIDLKCEIIGDATIPLLEKLKEYPSPEEDYYGLLNNLLIKSKKIYRKSKYTDIRMAIIFSLGRVGDERTFEYLEYIERTSPPYLGDPSKFQLMTGSEKDAAEWSIYKIKNRQDFLNDFYQRTLDENIEMIIFQIKNRSAWRYYSKDSDEFKDIEKNLYYLEEKYLQALILRIGEPMVDPLIDLLSKALKDRKSNMPLKYDQFYVFDFTINIFVEIGSIQVIPIMKELSKYYKDDYKSVIKEKWILDNIKKIEEKVNNE